MVFRHHIPYVYLQVTDLGGLADDVAIVPKPVLFAGLLNHLGQKGPAEIPAKRLHTYRQCAWLAGARGIPFRMPPAHPLVHIPLEDRGPVFTELGLYMRANTSLPVAVDAFVQLATAEIQRRALEEE